MLPPKVPAVLVPVKNASPARMAGPGSTVGRPPVPKGHPVRHEGYRRLVASLPCIRCGIVGYSQAAHPNAMAAGKGARLKTDDRLCFPLCCDRAGVVGCHTLWDQHKLVARAARCGVEQSWGILTRQTICRSGNWPADLLAWDSDASPQQSTTGPPDT